MTMEMDASSEQDDDDVLYWSKVMEKYRSTRLTQTLNQLNAVFVGRELVILTDRCILHHSHSQTNIHIPVLI